MNITTNIASYKIEWYPNQFFAEIYKDVPCKAGDYGFEYFATMPVDADTTTQDLQDFIEDREAQL